MTQPVEDLQPGDFRALAPMAADEPDIVENGPRVPSEAHTALERDGAPAGGADG
jgi:hypothetical protein